MINVTDQTDVVHEAVCSSISLGDDYVYYFGLYLIRKESDGDNSSKYPALEVDLSVNKFYLQIYLLCFYVLQQFCKNIFVMLIPPGPQQAQVHLKSAYMPVYMLPSGRLEWS